MLKVTILESPAEQTFVVEGALDYAISATAEYDAELTLLHVLEDVPSSARRKRP
jgi:hypothetical protein